MVLTASLLAIGAPFVAHIGSAEAAEVAAAGFVTSAKVDRPLATVGQSVAVTVSVRSDTTRRALIDLEVYDRAVARCSRRLGQRVVHGRPDTATEHRLGHQGRAAGTYTVKVGVFGAGWTSFIHWNDQAAAVRLTTSAPHDHDDNHDDRPRRRRPATTTTTTTTTTRAAAHDHDPATTTTTTTHTHDRTDHDDDCSAGRQVRDVARRRRPPDRCPVRRPGAPGG